MPVEAATPEVPAGAYVALTVTDSGTGIPPELHRKVFEPFFTTKPKGQGAAGLGLSTLYGIVSQCGGYVRMSSEVGVGTTFICYFPPAPLEPTSQVAEPDAAAGASDHATVLIVEDEAMVREVARRTLERLGYRVLTASDGLDGLGIAAAHAGPIDLVVTDVVMPQMGGRELANEIKRVRPNVKILFVSGYNEEISGYGSAPEADIEFMPKPYLPDSLSERVRQVLGGR